jgi:hypothetical protein
VGQAFGDDYPLTVNGEGFGSSITRSGEFHARLPNGSECTAEFSGGRLSLLGRSEVKTTATCTNGTSTQSVPAVVYRRSNGTPRQAILKFKDGTWVIVLIPKESARKVTPSAEAPATSEESTVPESADP